MDKIFNKIQNTAHALKVLQDESRLQQTKISFRRILNLQFIAKARCLAPLVGVQWHLRVSRTVVLHARPPLVP